MGGRGSGRKRRNQGSRSFASTATQTRSGRMPKVSKRFAYANKRNMARKNAPLKETKNRTDEEVHSKFQTSLTGYYAQNPIVPHLWPQAGSKVFPLKIFALDSMKQGVDEDQMTGRAVFAKYLKMKIQLNFPESTNVPQDQPDMYIVHGWIKDSPSLNGITSVEGVTNPENWSIQNDWDWIRDQLAPYFDEREDKLRYIPKQNGNVAIVDYHRVKPKVRQGWGRQRTTAVQFGDPTNTVLSVGTIMDYHRTIRWNMMKKIHYQMGDASTFTGTGSGRLNNFYINMNQWRPFACLYCPQLGDNVTNPPLTTANLPKVAYNSCLYYSDS